jgi:hypothetical protein
LVYKQGVNKMSYPTSPYLLYDNQYGVNREPFSDVALDRRFGEFSPQVSYDCVAPTVNASNPSVGENRLGIGYNNGILDYQFGSSMNVPFCGASVATGGIDCQKCPCQTLGCNSAAPGNGSCDYGFDRNHQSAFGPNGGNRYGNVKWG